MNKTEGKGWTRSFEVLSKQSCSTILYRINEQITNEILCDEASSVLEHDEKNLLFVAFWQADTTNTIYVVGYNYGGLKISQDFAAFFLPQSITGESQRKFGFQKTS